MNADRLDPLTLLRTQQIDVLHAHLNGIQVQFEAGQIGEHDLLPAFAPFNSSDLTLGDGFRLWMDAHPGTYAPHVAMASWFLGRGREARGQMTSNLVSDQGWRALQHFLEQADACARHATTFTANPLAAWVVLGRVSSIRGCDLTMEDVQRHAYPEWFTRGVEANPSSLQLRRQMLLNLRTEWGGSEEHMLSFVRQQQDARQLSDTDVQRLWAEFHSHVSHHAMHFANDPASSVERARLAADLHPAQAEQLFIALTDARAPVPERLEALRRFLSAAEQDPAVTPHGNFAWALHNSGDWAQPEVPRIGAFLTRSAGAGDPDAAIMLGELQISHPKWNLPDARPLLQQARDQGHTEAAELLVRYHEKTLSETLKDTPQKREDILKAADLLSGDMSWRVYRDFDAYRTQFTLDDRQKFRYLHRAADSGNNDARFELARKLRAGRVEVGEDGVLRPVDTAPLQGSLDYARHLLERAAGTNHRGAAKMLRATRDRDWQAATARRLNVAGATTNSGGFWQGWWKWMLAVAVIRQIAAMLGLH